MQYHGPSPNSPLLTSVIANSSLLLALSASGPSSTASELPPRRQQASAASPCQQRLPGLPGGFPAQQHPRLPWGAAEHPSSCSAVHPGSRIPSPHCAHCLLVPHHRLCVFPVKSIYPHIPLHPRTSLTYLHVSLKRFGTHSPTSLCIVFDLLHCPFNQRISLNRGFPTLFVQFTPGNFNST